LSRKRDGFMIQASLSRREINTEAWEFKKELATPGWEPCSSRKCSEMTSKLEEISARSRFPRVAFARIWSNVE